MTCACGCGQKTRLAPTSNASRGWVNGQPIRFVHGHHRRGTQRSPGTLAKFSSSVSREKHWNWKGGTGLSSDGYQWVLIGASHPMAGSQGRAFVHRLVMAGVLGRWLTRDEHVHHIDEDITNNRPENLALVTKQQHLRIHELIRHGVSAADAVREILDDRFRAVRR